MLFVQRANSCRKSTFESADPKYRVGNPRLPVVMIATTSGDNCKDPTLGAIDGLRFRPGHWAPRPPKTLEIVGIGPHLRLQASASPVDCMIRM